MGKQIYKYKLINFSNHINRLKDRNHTIISKKKVFDEMHHLFMIKIIERLGLEETLFNIKSTTGMTNIIVNEEKTFSLSGSVMRQGYSLSSILLNEVKY